MIIKGIPTNPGDLKIQVQVLTKTVNTNTGGFLQPAYTSTATVYAKWINAHGTEILAAMADEVVNEATVLIRYRSDIDMTTRIQKGSDIYMIRSMDNIQERNEYIELTLKRVVNG